MAAWRALHPCGSLAVRASTAASQKQKARRKREPRCFAMNYLRKISPWRLPHRAESCEACYAAAKTVDKWSRAMFDDPVTPIRRRFPTGPTWNLPEPPADAPTIPFAVRYGVPPEVVTYAKHERPPTRTKDEGL